MSRIQSLPPLSTPVYAHVQSSRTGHIPHPTDSWDCCFILCTHSCHLLSLARATVSLILLHLHWEMSCKGVVGGWWCDSVRKVSHCCSGSGNSGRTPLLEEASSHHSHKLIQLFKHLFVIFSGKKCQSEWKCRALVFQTYIGTYLATVVTQCIKQNKVDPKNLHVLKSFA